jgi:hypothetical protein
MSAAVPSSAVCYYHTSERLVACDGVTYLFSSGLPDSYQITIVDPFRCPRPECKVHYDAPLRGYFGASSDGKQPKYEPLQVPPLSCDQGGHDDRPMYLMNEFDKLVWACQIEGCNKRVQPSAELLELP